MRNGNFHKIKNKFSIFRSPEAIHNGDLTIRRKDVKTSTLRFKGVLKDEKCKKTMSLPYGFHLVIKRLLYHTTLLFKFNE